MQERRGAAVFKRQQLTRCLLHSCRCYSRTHYPLDSDTVINYAELRHPSKVWLAGYESNNYKSRMCHKEESETMGTGLLGCRACSRSRLPRIAVRRLVGERPNYLLVPRPLKHAAHICSPLGSV
ncbi:hypothetical protein J6590_020357 [Homalodisca vitripennis]|nr:hypothetical protein J6590_090723 [Homalodisca vitripennis]KAG8322653.1 hypothetical protein J6590_020357 [Homalodisca vitripennis]